VEEFLLCGVPQQCFLQNDLTLGYKSNNIFKEGFSPLSYLTKCDSVFTAEAHCSNMNISIKLTLRRHEYSTLKVIEPFDVTTSYISFY
jgi:hypothetical protein